MPIHVYDKLLVILSNTSMNSPWVKTEIANERTRETQQGRQMLFSITLVPFDRIPEWKCFDAETGTDSARKTGRTTYPTSRVEESWISYNQAVKRLVRDLQARPEKTDAQPAL
jgi:hypothetical protein